MVFSAQHSNPNIQAGVGVRFPCYLQTTVQVEMDPEQTIQLKKKNWTKDLNIHFIKDDL